MTPAPYDPGNKASAIVGGILGFCLGENYSSGKWLAPYDPGNKASAILWVSFYIENFCLCASFSLKGLNYLDSFDFSFFLNTKML